MAAVAEARTKIAENLIIAVGFGVCELERLDCIGRIGGLEKERRKRKESRYEK